MPNLKNWYIVTHYDYLFIRDGCAMRNDDWEWCHGDGLVERDEINFAFRTALAKYSEQGFRPVKGLHLPLSGYATEMGVHGLSIGIARNKGDHVMTSDVSCFITDNETGDLYAYTRSGSAYKLLGGEPISHKYAETFTQDKSPAEADALVSKYFYPCEKHQPDYFRSLIVQSLHTNYRVRIKT